MVVDKQQKMAVAIIMIPGESNIKKEDHLKNIREAPADSRNNL